MEAQGFKPMTFPKLDSLFVIYIGIELYAVTIPTFCVIIQPLHHASAYSPTSVFLPHEHIIKLQMLSFIQLMQQPNTTAADQPFVIVNAQTLVSAHGQHRLQAAFQHRNGKLPLIQFVNQGQNTLHFSIGNQFQS